MIYRFNWQFSPKLIMSLCKIPKSESLQNIELINLPRILKLTPSTHQIKTAEKSSSIYCAFIYIITNIEIVNIMKFCFIRSKLMSVHVLFNLSIFKVVSVIMKCLNKQTVHTKKIFYIKKKLLYTAHREIFTCWTRSTNTPWSK